MPLKNKRDRLEYQREWYRRNKDGRHRCPDCDAMRMFIGGKCQTCEGRNDAGFNKAINQFLYKGAA